MFRECAVVEIFQASLEFMATIQVLTKNTEATKYEEW